MTLTIIGKACLSSMLICTGQRSITRRLDVEYDTTNVQERNLLIQSLQEISLRNSVRITILGGDVHLGAVGQFYSNKKLDIPLPRDHRYMCNVISSAIVNTPPSETVGDLLYCLCINFY